MKLFIDTSNNKKIVVGLDKKRWEFETKEPRSQKLLGLIDKTMRKQDALIDKITEVEVNLGPGSFTGLRVGISVANVLGWALKIPINGKKIGDLVEPKYE